MNPVHRLVRVVGVQRRQAQVPGLGERPPRAPSISRVADLADQDHVRRLAQGVDFSASSNEWVSIPTSRWVTMQPLRCLMDELDRVLDGDDVTRWLLVVAIPHHRGQRGRFTGARAPHQTG
jgi:hypothetical protein